jgi:hypothetical protein
MKSAPEHGALDSPVRESYFVVAVLDVVVVAVAPVVVVLVVAVVPVDSVVAAAGVAVVVVVAVVAVSSTTFGASVVVVSFFSSVFVQATTPRSEAETAPRAIIDRNFFMSISFFLVRSSLSVSELSLRFGCNPGESERCPCRDGGKHAQRGGRSRRELRQQH